ncbi:MAG TPA: 1,4-dihydroxy-2-naphthoate polyprenyltransferase, partial [Clostridiaceae bacterium]|nr:1,4-dihydroxy-2-naphthoate polyprenyltransferase [Clostridiaceae bacterium]
LLATYFLVSEHIKLFYEHQSKKDTFVLAVKNFIIINGALAIALGLGAVISVLI